MTNKEYLSILKLINSAIIQTIPLVPNVKDCWKGSKESLSKDFKIFHIIDDKIGADLPAKDWLEFTKETEKRNQLLPEQNRLYYIPACQYKSIILHSF